MATLISGPFFFFIIFISTAFGSESSVAYPVTCETRGADLTEDVVVVLCPPGCSQGQMSVFGTGIYASVSSVCGAALHRGALRAAGGPIRVHKLQGRNDYLSSYAHGIQSQPLTQWSSSFSLTKPVHVPLELTSNSSTTTQRPVKKPVKKPSVKKTVIGGNKDCQMDIAMVMDSSKNIGQRRFNLQKNFIIKLAAMLKVGPTGPHVGVIQASEHNATVKCNRMKSQKVRRRPESCHAYHPKENAKECGGATAVSLTVSLFFSSLLVSLLVHH
ncbi:cochlin [Solea senegalensis]|uniref:Cochlin n=1 Tax=Solea senegalensis TaxID=28829 RepID=A0AAV6T028_SOLSE|nr:cochlin [Solea senegalensis]